MCAKKNVMREVQPRFHISTANHENGMENDTTKPLLTLFLQLHYLIYRRKDTRRRSSFSATDNFWRQWIPCWSIATCKMKPCKFDSIIRV